MSEVNARPQFSAVIPVGRRVDDLDTLIGEYRAALDSTGAAYELIVVLDGRQEELPESLRPDSANAEGITVIELSRTFGESVALMAGFDAARADCLVTLPAYHQVDAREISKLLSSFGADNDMLVAVRSPRSGGFFELVRRSAFHWAFEFVSRMRYRDLGCGVRIFKREVAEEIPLYGDQYRFLPALAERRGFRVREVELAQSSKDRFRGHYRLREYLHAFLDVLTVFFLVRFTKKPLRFFGTIGVMTGAVGGLFLALLVVQRLVFGMPLADRPALLLGTLLVVLGVQVFALGLVGELIIFTHASGMKEYTIRSVHQTGGAAPGREKLAEAEMDGPDAGRAKRLANVTDLP